MDNNENFQLGRTKPLAGQGCSRR